MSSPTKREHHEITVREMCVIERLPDGSLRTAFRPIGHDAQVWGRLSSLRNDMRDWEDRQEERLASGVGSLLADVVGVQETGVISAANHFWRAAITVCQLTGFEGNLGAFYPAPAHDYWRDLYGSGIHLLPEYSGAIRGFDVTRGAVYACRSLLDEEAYRNLEQAYYLASGMKPHLLAALEEYERKFYAYVKEAGRICPGLFDTKSFCRDFSAAYGNAELDFDISPGNQCIVESLNQYYWAFVLEQLYGTCEAEDNLVAYSHRRLGWRGSDQRIPIEPRCDLYLLMKSNFGFGQDRYFGSLLSYKGVNSINASMVMFFQGVGKMGVFDFTFPYKTEEASFETCFDDAVRLCSEYRNMGEARFVERHFRKPLQDLSDLLCIVAHTGTFLKVTTVERFNALTSGPRNALIPSEGFSSIDLSLSASEKRAAELIVQTILPIMAEGGIDDCVSNPKVQALLNQVLSPHGQGGLQLIVKKDLVRSCIVKGLAASLPGASDLGKLAETLIPPDAGIYVEAYEGYSLIKMRVDRALSVIEPRERLERLQEIARLTSFESVIDSIVSTCLQIGEQAQSYIFQSIDPELGRMVPERNRLKSQLDATNAEIDKAKHRSIPVPAWLARQSLGLKAQIRSLNGTIAELEQQKRKLADYIRTVNSIRTAG